MAKEPLELAQKVSILMLLPPHPKDGEGTVFTSVCLSTRGGVPHGLWSQILSLVSGPLSFPKGYLMVSDPRSLPWSLDPGPFWEMGGQNRGYPTAQNLDGYAARAVFSFVHAGGLSCF